MMTPLDQAHARMEATPGDDAARLRFYQCLADGELILLLQDEPQDENLTPQVFELEDGPVVLAFDSEERLSAFAGAIVPYAALPGRVVAGLLAGQGIGLGVNLGVAPSSTLLPPEALDWLAKTLGTLAPDALETTAADFRQPVFLPEALVAALRIKLTPAASVIAAALIAEAAYPDGSLRYLLALVDVPPEAETPLARACAEAVAFCGLEESTLDVTFPRSTDALLRAMAPVAQTLDLPRPVAAPPIQPQAPGTDPSRPPILR